MEEKAVWEEADKVRKAEEAKVDYYRCAGVDPGAANLGVAAVQERGAQPSIHRVTAKSYQHRAGIKAEKKRFERLKKKSDIFRCVCEDTLSLKTTNLLRMATAIEQHFVLFADAYEFCQTEKFNKNRFTTWIKSKRALTWAAKQLLGEKQDKLDPFASTRAERRAERLAEKQRREQAQVHPVHEHHSTPERKWRRKKKRKEKREERAATLVGIGHWARKASANGSIHGYRHAPHQGLRKALLQRPGVVMVDINEAYTSKRCYHCQRVDCEMHQVMLKKEALYKLWDELGCEPEDEKAVACYHVLRCNQCRNPVQCDVNASLNILRLTRGKREGLARPPYLSRNPGAGVTEATRQLDKAG